MAYRPSGSFVLSLSTILVVVGGGVFLSRVEHCGPHGKNGSATLSARMLQQGIQSFSMEYGQLPRLAPSSCELLTNGTAGVELLTILRGRESNGDSVQNPKRISFVSFKETKNKRNGGLVFSDPRPDARPQGLYDSWGNPFRVFIRPAEATDLVFTHGGKLVILKDTSVAVISAGADGEEGTKDDIRTW